MKRNAEEDKKEMVNAMTDGKKQKRERKRDRD